MSYMIRPKIVAFFINERHSVCTSWWGWIFKKLIPSQKILFLELCSWKLGDPQCGWMQRALREGEISKNKPLCKQILIYNPPFSGSNPICKIQDVNAAASNMLKDNWGNVADRWEVLHLGGLPSKPSFQKDSQLLRADYPAIQCTI